jgi:hypothetical protein
MVDGRCVVGPRAGALSRAVARHDGSSDTSRAAASAPNFPAADRPFFPSRAGLHFAVSSHRIIVRTNVHPACKFSLTHAKKRLKPE